MKTNKIKVLIVDDEDGARYGIRKALGKSGYEIHEATNGKEALAHIKAHSADIVLSDIYMPEIDGLELVRHIHSMASDQPLVIVLTAFGSEKLAVEAMKAGAYDYLSKPFNIDELRLTINKAVEKLLLERENIALKQQLGEKSQHDILGNSPQIKQIHKLIDKVAPANITVLLTGESGTGKELVARTIHNTSSRKNGPFITMNCAAIPKDLVESELFGHEKGAFTGATSQREGKFEIADKGTLFLDEIADMSMETQAKILRILEEKSFTRLGGSKSIQTDVRLISATNKDLQQEIANERFREDLYYRIKVVELKLPALRNRTGDIAVLAEYFVGLYAERHGKTIHRIEPGALQILLQYNWPGNVRQLMHVIEQSVVLSEGNSLTCDVLPLEIQGNLSFKEQPQAFVPGQSFTEAKEQAVIRFETGMITGALKQAKGNVSEAARLLKMKRQFLQQKMKNLEIDPKDYK